MAIVDFTNPDAAAWYQEKLAGLLDLGVDCFKTDFGERIPTDCVYFSGADPVRMHNYYTYLYNKCVYELLARRKGAKDAVLFARSASVGGQKFPVHWGGDCWSTYTAMRTEMISQSMKERTAFTWGARLKIFVFRQKSLSAEDSEWYRYGMSLRVVMFQRRLSARL